MTFPTLVDHWSESIAHEVNQPLAAMVTNAQSCLAWLRKEQPDLDRARKAAERIVTTGYYASAVVRSIHTLQRKSPPLLAPLNVDTLIADALQLLSTEISDHGVSVQTQLCCGVACVPGDRTQLQQVLVNLIRNGIESMRESAASLPRVLSVSASLESGDTLRIAVADSGIGLDERTISRLFEPFFTTKNQGAGLGLAICRNIVEGHGGRLWATPRLPRGSVFQFTLPLHPR